MTLYVSDLDGTLLDPTGQLADSTRAGLVRLLDEGLTFTIASARHIVSIKQLLGNLPLQLPVISSNGAYLSDYASGRHEMVNAMEPSLAQEVFALIRRHDKMPFVATHGPKGDQLFWQSAHNEAQERFVEERHRNRDPRFRQVERLQDVLHDPAVTIVVVDRAEPLQALMTEVEGLAQGRLEIHMNEDLYRPGWPWLTIHDRRATKDQAIKTLAERYDLHEREIVVFGDHINDVSMLRAAHRGIAVGNAIDAVKAVAHTVIGPHHEDSVVRFIETDWRRPPGSGA